MNVMRIRLARGDHLRIRDGHGAHVAVGHGTAWLTQHGDRRDIVIGAGESFRIDRDGVTVVSILFAAEISVSAESRESLPVIDTSRRARHGPAASLRTFTFGRTS